MQGPEPLVITTRVDEQRAVIELGGVLDLDGMSALSSAVAALLERPLVSVEVDAGGLRFIDSGGLRALLLARQAAAAVDVRLGVAARSDAVDRVLAMSGLGEYLGMAVTGSGPSERDGPAVSQPLGQGLRR